MKKIITALLAVCTALVFTLPAFASEEIKCGFYMRNIGPDPVTVTITNMETKESEEVILKGQEQKWQEYAFTEPETVRYLLEDPASPEKHNYIAELFVETDEKGKLTGHTAAWIAGSTVKPEELLFGTRPPVAQTGDTGNSRDYLLACGGAGTLITAISLSLLFNRKKGDSHAERKKD